MSFDNVGHDRRDALISAAFESIEDTNTIPYPLSVSNTSFWFDRDATPESCSTALLSLGIGQGDGTGCENVAKSSRIAGDKELKDDKMHATASEVQRLLHSMKKKQQHVRQRAKGGAIQEDEHRPWKVKALTALSHLKSMEQQCFEAERRVCDLQAKYDALVLEKSDMEVECERYRAAWGHAIGRMDAMELEVRILQGRVNMYEARIASEHADADEEKKEHEVDDVIKSILMRGKENTAKHAESKIREEVEKEHKEELRRVEDEHRLAVSQRESELAEMEIALDAHRQENATLQDSVRGLEEHLLHAQSRIVQLQEENEYYASFVDSNTAESEDEDVFKDAVWELKQEIGEREEELLAMQECLNEEKARSNGLHEQILRQVMELEDLRKDACRTRELEEELKALRHVHAETLKDMAELKLVQSMNDRTATRDAKTKKDDDCSSPSPIMMTRQNGNPFDDESWLI